MTHTVAIENADTMGRVTFFLTALHEDGRKLAYNVPAASPMALLNVKRDMAHANFDTMWDMEEFTRLKGPVA